MSAVVLSGMLTSVSAAQTKLGAMPTLVVGMLRTAPRACQRPVVGGSPDPTAVRPRWSGQETAPRRRFCRLLAGLLTLLAVTEAFAQEPPGGMPPAPVAVAEVQQQKLNIGRTFVGDVAPLRSSTVGSPVEGRVVEFVVNEGDRVTKGQPLAQLRVVSLEIDREIAEAELKIRKAELQELTISQPKEIEQAAARRDSAAALMEYNRLRLERMRKLHESNVVGDEQFEEQISAAKASEETYREAESAWELATSGLWEAKIDQANARVLAQEETIRRLEDDISEHSISAPFDGYVTGEHTEVGQWIAKGGPVVELVQLDQVDVEVHVLEKYISQLRIDAEARVEVEALPGEILVGRVVLIVPSANLRTRNFPVKVRLENRPAGGDKSGRSDMMLKPGMFARVTLPVGQIDSAVMVPKDALVLGSATPIVWVVDTTGGGSQGSVRPVPVELGVSHEGTIEVRGNLEAGQLVVVEGNERLNPMRPVIIVKKIGAPNAEQPGEPPEADPAGQPAE